MKLDGSSMLGVLLFHLILYVVVVRGSTSECFTQRGAAYNGTLNHTAKGEPCLPWSEFPNLRLRKSWNATFMKEQSNFCRNLDSDPRGPWCMVTRAKYGTCAIPHCGRLTLLILAYLKKIIAFKHNHFQYIHVILNTQSQKC